MSFKIVNATNILGGKLQCIHGKEIHNWCEECNNKLNKEKPKMTREEALNKLKNIKTPLSVENIVDILEEVGLLEFEEEKKVNVYKGESNWTNKDYGKIRLEEWPEGLVLWVGGEIKWKSWGAPLPK